MCLETAEGSFTNLKRAVLALSATPQKQERRGLSASSLSQIKVAINLKEIFGKVHVKFCGKDMETIRTSNTSFFII